jgi:hypothetical protein
MRTRLLCALAFTACSSPGGTSSGSSGTSGASTVCKPLVQVERTISAPTTWKRDSVYVVGKTGTTVNAALTIEAGTVIKFEDGMHLNVGTGSVQARGTETDPIVFTSVLDDEHGGDCNADGASVATKGSWGGVRVDSTATASSVFQYVEFLYAGASNPVGASEFSAVLDMHDSSTFDHCTFAHTAESTNIKNAKGALALSGDDNARTICTNNVFFDNGIPLKVFNPNVLPSVAASNRFSDPSSPSTTNRFQGIFLNDGNAFTKSASLSVTEVPYVFEASIVTLADKVDLAFANGVTVKFLPLGMITYGPESTLTNADNATVVFTSIDDDLKGNSGGTGTPAAGSWEGIFQSGASEWKTWPSIRYAKAH